VDPCIWTDLSHKNDRHYLLIYSCSAVIRITCNCLSQRASKVSKKITPVRNEWKRRNSLRFWLDKHFAASREQNTRSLNKKRSYRMLFNLSRSVAKPSAAEEAMVSRLPID